MTGDIVTAVVWGVIVAGAGALLTELSPWYYALKRPWWQPPDWLFGPAWTLILGLASYSLYLSLRDTDDSAMVLGLFVVNGFLNLIWSPMFFTRRRPDWALAEVPFLWLSILAPIILLPSRLESLLMVPYLLWVSFAAFLNFTVVRLNRPFSGRPSRRESRPRS